MGVSPVFFASRQFRRASSRIALVIAAALFATSLLDAQRRGGSPLDTVGREVDQGRGRQVLENYRMLGIAGDYRLNFELRIMPRGEKTRQVYGLLLGTMVDAGPVTRVDIALEPSSVTNQGQLVPARVRRLLLHNGLFANAAEVESWKEGQEPELIETGRYFEPLAGSDFTVFDLLMPFNFWQRYEYEGRTTLRSRPAHVYWLYPPEDDEFLKERVSRVRIYLDEEFNALNRVEIYGPDGEHRKTISVVAFKIVDGQGILSQIDVRDELTRGKTRFRVLDAAVGVDLPEWVFSADGLKRNVYGTELASVEPSNPAVAD